MTERSERDDPLRIVFLVNATSNKSRTTIDRFAEEWDVVDASVACVVSSASGTAAEAARSQGYPTIVCSDSSEQEGAIERATERIGGCDYLVSIGWTYLVPDEALEMPEQAALNVHSSYLPAYKGLSVHRAQWANAERTGGVTVHRMTESFDAGRIVAQQRYRIGLFDTPIAMTNTIGALSAALVREAILKIEQGYEGEPQPEEGNYYSLLPWSTVLQYGLVNHLYRALGSESRFPVPTDDDD
ncbi:Folate-dependent phosphoribosylglycinamide formyltransferase PurN [Halanaeroarchaeum sp. HSR-CO]|uniref:formyltransferase family protein n=1 Tax=Halanaeroarchaeum sp. HSR-CO TaxID=2866382 RepID=UPI00217CE5E4|nr:formyltransferase family protein [Halanaeroarchaeum sp. HSR-CO]UWG48163.1 Folate-dependent phosphoribosylglycinamide formyltransferase PurN [Halanaeroarchaeum sp. HSR-CO]